MLLVNNHLDLDHKLVSNHKISQEVVVYLDRLSQVLEDLEELLLELYKALVELLLLLVSVEVALAKHQHLEEPVYLVAKLNKLQLKLVLVDLVEVE